MTAWTALGNITCTVACTLETSQRQSKQTVLYFAFPLTPQAESFPD